MFPAGCVCRRHSSTYRRDNRLETILDRKTSGWDEFKGKLTVCLRQCLDSLVFNFLVRSITLSRGAMDAARSFMMGAAFRDSMN
jgi:hypothetical protein